MMHFASGCLVEVTTRLENSRSRSGLALPTSHFWGPQRGSGARLAQTNPSQATTTIATGAPTRHASSERIPLSVFDKAPILSARGPSMANVGRNLSLTDRHRRFVAEQVASGRHASASEVVREALRRYEDDIAREQAYLEMLNRLAEEGEAAYAKGNYTRLSSREQVRKFIRESGRQAARRDVESDV